MVKAIFYLPVRDNDGRRLTVEIEQAASEVYSRFGGWTLLGYYKGTFRMADGS
jgi:hypothetical protein